MLFFFGTDGKMAGGAGWETVALADALAALAAEAVAEVGALSVFKSAFCRARAYVIMMMREIV
jgi:hypothetical protein